MANKTLHFPHSTAALTYLKPAETKKESRQGWDPTFICRFSRAFFYVAFGSLVIPTLSQTF